MNYKYAVLMVNSHEYPICCYISRVYSIGLQVYHEDAGIFRKKFSNNARWLFGPPALTLPNLGSRLGENNTECRAERRQIDPALSE